MVYAFVKKDFDYKMRMVILLISLPICIAHIFIFFNFPCAGILGTTMFIPIVAFLYMIIKELRSYKNELGFLSIFAIDAGIRFAMTLEWLNS